MNEEIKELLELVRQMRKYQKNYFKFRERDDLNEARWREQEVDKRLARLLEIPTNQLSIDGLFGGDV